MTIKLLASTRRASRSHVRQPRRTLAGTVLVVAALTLCACTAAAPPSPVPAKSSNPSPSSYSVPIPVNGELARIVYSASHGSTGVSVDVPVGGGYNVDFGCTATSSSASIGFELRNTTSTVMAGTGHCDGSRFSDTALDPDHPAEAVHLVLTGDLSEISRAYLILAPTQPS